MPSIADLIEQHRERLLQRYLEEASRLPSAQEVHPEEVLDNLPEYLSALIALSRGQRGDPSHVKRRIEETHIGLRLRLGYTLEDATAEFVLLGRLLSRLWEPLPPEQQPTPEDTQRLFDALQSAIEHTTSVFRGYSLEDRQAEKRALRRMDALAADLPDRLEPLLEIIREALHTDAATVLLVDAEGQRLIPTASAGRWSTPPDRGCVPLRPPAFVAELASSTEVVHLPDATTTHLALGEGVRLSGIHSLLGLRLYPRGQLLGVVYLGTTDARLFEPRARRLLETLVERLALLIDRARLLQELRQSHLRLAEAHPPRKTPADLSEERLRLAVEATHLGTWDLDPTTGALHWDERSRALFGQAPDAPVVYDTFLSLLHPEDRARVDNEVRRALESTGSGTFQMEYRVVDPRDGTERWLSANGRAFFDASGKAVRFLGTVLDITERGRAHQAVERERHRATTLLESISEAFFAVDPTWRFTYVNREAERLLGHGREELLGRDHWEVFPATVGTPLERQYRRAATERLPLAFEEHDPQRDLWFDIRVYPSTEGLAVFFRDVTDTKRRDEERERLLGIVSHDLRIPLNSITLATDALLLRENVPESVLSGVRRIARSAARMSRMITDLLDFTRARVGGGIPLQRRPTRLLDLVRSTLEEFEVSHPDRIVLSTGPGPFTGEWDPDRLAQVVSNLVGNALQHGAQGTPVRVGLRVEGPDVLLTVTNQGDPIPEPLLPLIFDPFRRAAHSRSQGLGLGLYIVQQLVLAHGGFISVNSREDTGTTFTVRLPREPARA